MAENTPNNATNEPNNRRWWTGLLFWSLLILSALGLSQVPNWSMETRVEQYMPGHWKQSWQTFAAVNERFGFDRTLIVMVKAAPNDDVFSPAMMKLNKELTIKFSRTSGVKRVLSLGNGMTIRKQGDAMVVRPLMPNSLKGYGSKEQKALRKLALSDPLLRGSMIADSGRASLFLISLPSPPKGPKVSQAAKAKAAQAEAKTVQAILALLKPYKTSHPRVTLGVVGQPFVAPLLEKQLKQQLPTAISLFVLWNLLLFLLFIPSWRRKGWFIGASICAIFLGVASHTGWHRGLHVSMLWVPLWVWWVLGLWSMFAPSHEDNRPPQTWLWVGTALLSTWGLTLWFHPWPMMRRWGLTTTLTLMGVLALGWFFSPPTSSKQETIEPTPFVVPSFLRVLTVALVIVLGAGSAMLSFGLTSLKPIYPPHGLLFHGEEISQQEFGGAAPFFIRFRGNLQDPVHLKAMVRVGQRLEALNGVSPVQSYGVIVRQLHNMLNQLPRIPDSQLKIKSLAILLEGQPALSSLVRDNNNDGIIQGRIKITNALQQSALLAQFTKALQGLPLRYKKVDWKTAKPALRKQLAEARVQWVAEGIALWLKKHTGLAFSTQTLLPTLQAYLQEMQRPKARFVLEQTRLQRRLRAYLLSEDCDVELKKPEQRKVMLALMRLNLQGQFLSKAEVRKTLEAALQGTPAGKDKQGLRYAVRSLQSMGQALYSNQRLTQLQQQLFRQFAQHKQWIKVASKRLRSGTTQQSRERIAAFRGHLLELHNPNWTLVGQGPQRLHVEEAGLHRMFLPLATATFRYGRRAAWLLLLLSFVLCWLMVRSFSGAFRIWLPTPLTLFMMLGLLGWLNVSLDLTHLFLLLFLGGVALFPSLYLYYAQRSHLQLPSGIVSHRTNLIRMALWISLPSSALLFMPLPPLQSAGIILTLGPWLALLACIPSHAKAASGNNES
ncbi:MAG: hypothetical protein EP343_01335 [Deltaproteobacteria bacterium]|nr:MAG: hypothetical protein EP343_01335 [Deltaproteobacteria bacterium]